MKFVTLVAFIAMSAPALAAPAYTVTKTVALGAPDNWDYVVYDSSLDRVYIGHSTETTIVDGNSGAIVGHFMGLNGAHGTCHCSGYRPVALPIAARTPRSPLLT